MHKIGQPIRSIIVLWVIWALIILGFQALLTARIIVYRPDHAVSWTPGETAKNSQRNKPYLLEPFMNAQVSWDSEYYLSIAVGGYEDPVMRRVKTPIGRQSQNFAFMPFYPQVVRVVAVPLQIFGLSPIATATLAGVFVSLLGTLGGMIALRDLLKDELGERGAFRAVFYMLIFPTGFFLAQVYTEGLFIGLAFGSLALLRRGQWHWAALLAIPATLTRAVGAALVVPLGLAWLREFEHGQPLLPQLTWQRVIRGLSVLAPLLTILIWQQSHYGQMFLAVEDGFFGREFFAVERSLGSWSEAWRTLFTGNVQSRIYYALEIFSVGLAVMACLLTLRRYPGLALFGLLAIAVSAFSGHAQSMLRYMLVIPSIYILLGRLGRNVIFDRAWTTISVLLLGMSMFLFASDMWVG